MRPKIVSITVCHLMALSSVMLQGQGPDAADKAQAVYDQHKSADPTNSDRSLTGKSRQTEAHISQVPISPASTPKLETLKRIRDLEQERDNFNKKKAESGQEKKLGGGKFASSNMASATPSEDWEKSDDARTLRRLKAEVVEAYKTRQRGEAKISDVPVSKTSR